MALKNLTLEKKDRIALLSVNRPKALNALNRETMRELRDAFAALESDEDAGAVILTGTGDKSFVAGADINELAGLNAAEGRDLALDGQAVFRAVELFPKPVIAAVNGFCLGGGCELALSCHIRVASESARFGQPEVKLGLIPGYGGTQRLSRLVGKGRAMELILSGDMIAAAEALKCGLVNHVVAAEELIPHCRALARRILKNAPAALRYAIEAVNRGLESPIEEALALEASLFGLACATGDMKEGTRAFLEKRAPRFEGK